MPSPNPVQACASSRLRALLLCAILAAAAPAWADATPDSPPPQNLDYQAGLFYIDVENDVDYQKVWGHDAGAWYANPTQYARLDADPTGRYLLQQSLDGLNMSWNSPTGTQQIRNTSGAPFAQANWHLTSALTLTTGGRLSFENRQNNGSTFIRDFGFAPELNPVAVNGVPLGGFSSTNAGVLTTVNSLEQLSLADKTANKYFGAAITGAPGAAYNALGATQKQQLADAKAIRAAQSGWCSPGTPSLSWPPCRRSVVSPLCGSTTS